MDLRCIEWHTGPRTLLVFVRSFHCVQTRAVTDKEKKQGAGLSKGGWEGGGVVQSHLREGIYRWERQRRIHLCVSLVVIELCTLQS